MRLGRLIVSVCLHGDYYRNLCDIRTGTRRFSRVAQDHGGVFKSTNTDMHRNKSLQRVILYFLQKMTLGKNKRNHRGKQTDTWERSETTSVQRVDVRRGRKRAPQTDLKTAILKLDEQHKAWHRTGLMSTNITAAIIDWISPTSDQCPGRFWVSLFHWNRYGFWLMREGRPAPDRLLDT